MVVLRRAQRSPNALLVANAVLAACALAAVASFTHPFTTGADVVTSVALGAMLAAQVRRALRGRATRAVARFADCIPWIMLWAAVIGFELFAYLSEPRRAYPTLSSLSDDLTRSQPGRAALFLLWLALGAMLLGPRTVSEGHE